MSLPPPASPLEFASMPPEDVRLLVAVGRSIKYGVQIANAELSVYGAYVVLVSIALFNILRRPQKSLRTALLLSALVITFTVATIYCTLDVFLFQTKIEKMLIENPHLPFRERLNVYYSLPFLGNSIVVLETIAGNADTGVLFLVNDILAAWRAMSVWRSGSRRIMGTILYFLVFTALAFWIAFVILTVQFYDAGTTGNSTVYAIVSLTNSSVSIAANLMATCMIGIAAYKHMRLEYQSGVKSLGAKILVLLAESGVLYVVIQSIRLALTICIVPSTIPYGPLDTANMAFGRASTMLTAMYTPSLILIIQYGYSIADTIQMERSSSDSPRGRAGVDNEKTVSGIIFRPDARSGGDSSFTESQVTPSGTVMTDVAGDGATEKRMTVKEVV